MKDGGCTECHLDKLKNTERTTDAPGASRTVAEVSEKSASSANTGIGIALPAPINGGSGHRTGKLRFWLRKGSRARRRQPKGFNGAEWTAPPVQVSVIGAGHRARRPCSRTRQAKHSPAERLIAGRPPPLLSANRAVCRRLVACSAPAAEWKRGKEGGRGPAGHFLSARPAAEGSRAPRSRRRKRRFAVRFEQ